MKKHSLLIRLIIAIAIGLTVGAISSRVDNFVAVKLLLTFSSIFGSFLKYMIPLIIIGFVAPGIADLGGKASKLLAYAAGLAYLSAVLAGIGGYFIGSALLPGIVGGELSPFQEGLNPYLSIEISPIMEVITALVTAFILGLGLAYSKEERLYEVLSEFQQIISSVVHKIILPLLPIHIGGIFANMLALGRMANTLVTFSRMFVLIILLQISYLIIQYVLTFVFTGKHPFTAIVTMLPAYFTALGTQSSTATLPVTLECAKNNGVSEDVADFVIPLGATIHLAGDTITLVIAAMTIMIISGIQPTFTNFFPYILMLGLTMIAAPGIPGGGVFAALGLLETILGFSTGQQSLMVALHLAQDSFGTATNVTGDGALALIINRIANRTNTESLYDKSLHPANNDD